VPGSLSWPLLRQEAKTRSGGAMTYDPTLYGRDDEEEFGDSGAYSESLEEDFEEEEEEEEEAGVAEPAMSEPPMPAPPPPPAPKPKPAAPSGGGGGPKKPAAKKKAPAKKPAAKKKPTAKKKAAKPARKKAQSQLRRKRQKSQLRRRRRKPRRAVVKAHPNSGTAARGPRFCFVYPTRPKRRACADQLGVMLGPLVA